MHKHYAFVNKKNANRYFFFFILLIISLKIVNKNEAKDKELGEKIFDDVVTKHGNTCPKILGKNKICQFFNCLYYN